MKSFTSLLALSLALLPLTAAADSAAPVSLVAALGGRLVEPVAVDSYVYVGSGAIISAWDYSRAKAPVLRDTTSENPARGAITGLVRQGDFLYASWGTYGGSGGIAVYSIANRAHPVLIGQYEDYTAATSRSVQGIAISNDHLYLFDSVNGVFVSALTQPAHPRFTPTKVSVTSDTLHPYVQGNRIYVTGRDFLFDTTLQIIDTSAPEAPTTLGSASLDGFNNYRLKIEAPYAIGFGTSVSVTDFSNPAQIVPRGRVNSPVAYTGVVLGNYAYGVGGSGLDIWNIADPNAPAAAGHAAIDTFDTDAAVPYQTGALLLTRTDQIVQLDAKTALQPKVASTALIAGGTSARDLAVVGDRALLLQEDYGIGIADRETLAPRSQFEAALPEDTYQRAFQQMAVDGSRAYLTAWGTGFIIADVSDPDHPAELGRLAYPGAISVDVANGHAYLGRGGEFAVVDVSDPANPTPLAALPMSRAMRIKVAGHFAFVADQSIGGDGGGGFRIVDVSNPTAPVQVALYGACSSANDVALDKNGTTAFVACDDGLHIVDVSKPNQPVARGIYPVASQTVALLHGRLYAGNADGFDEIEFDHRSQPARVAHHALPVPPVALREGSEGRLFAFTGTAGVYVFK